MSQGGFYEFLKNVSENREDFNNYKRNTLCWQKEEKMYKKEELGNEAVIKNCFGKYITLWLEVFNLCEFDSHIVFFFKI